MNESNLKTIDEEVNYFLKSQELNFSSDQERIFHIWQSYQLTQSTLKSTLENIDVLRSQFANETKDFESYVDHITKLSDEREARAAECETENAILKDQLQLLRLQLASFDNSETRDMLLQAGLDDIIHVRPGAQIAYLLVERARLMDVVDEWQNVGTSEIPDAALDARLTSSNRVKDSRQSWNKLKELLDKVDELELNNEQLVQRLAELSSDEKNVSISLNGNDKMSLSASTGVNSVPKKPFSPPKNLQEAITRLRVAEEKLAEVESLQVDLKAKQLDHSINEDEASSASLIGSPRTSLAARELERHNADLHNAMSAVDNHLQQLILNNSGGLSEALNERSHNEVASKLSIVQQEFERVKTELVKMMEKYRVQYRKYADHKLSVRNRIHSLKESFRQERLKLTEEIERLDNDLGLVKVTLEKELQYKEDMEKSHRTLLLEQQELQLKLSEQEDLFQEKCREVAKIKVETLCLQDENSGLRQRMDGNTRHKNLFHIISP